MIDSHCHLGDKQFTADLPQVLERAAVAGVDRCIAIADDLSEAQRCLEIAEAYENVWCTAGIHPHVSGEWKVLRQAQEGLESGKLLKGFFERSLRVVAVGEIGLDYYYDNAPREVQREVFSEQLKIANEIGKPVVIHNRDSQNQSSADADSGSGQAWDDLWEIVQREEPPNAVLHCCTEPWSRVSQWIERGYLLSFTGIATYPKSEEIRETIRYCPLEQMMIETDAPYLAPVPYRGKRNEPAFVIDVAKCIAEVKGISLEEVDAVTTANAEGFFGLSEN